MLLCYSAPDEADQNGSSLGLSCTLAFLSREVGGAQGRTSQGSQGNGKELAYKARVESAYGVVAVL